MKNWLWAVMILPETVERRHYFLEALDNDIWIWGIRIACVLAAVAAFIVYKKMKDGDGE